MKTVSSEPKLVWHDLAGWREVGNAYFEPSSNTIHLLRGEVIEQRLYEHEYTHYLRHNKLTARVGGLLTLRFFSPLILVLALVSGLVAQPLLMLAVGLFFFVVLCCWQFEESMANKAMIGVKNTPTLNIKPITDTIE